MRHHLGLTIFIILVAYPLYGAAPLGIFEDHVDVGEPNVPGTADFQNGVYTVDAVGATIGLASLTDQFHFVYKKMKGNFAIQANPLPLDNVGWGGIMIRQSLDADSVHVSLLLTSEAAIEGSEALEFSVYPTFRSIQHGATKRQGDPEPGGLTNSHTGPIRLERFGNSFYFYTINKAGKKILIRTEIVPMDDEVLVGLAATAEQVDGYGRFEFSNVSIDEYPLSVLRKFPVETYQKGTLLSPITLTASVRAGQVANATITEAIPLGTVASNAKVSAGIYSTLPDGSISWALPGLSGNATLTYDLKLGPTDSVAFTGTFSDGVNPKSYLGGDAVLPKTYSFPATSNSTIIDPSFVTVIQCEQGIPSDENGWGLMFDPRTLSGITAVSVNTSANSTLEFPITILQDGTYYILANVRGEDGNSDSFYFELDAPPAGDDSTTWDITGDKRYVLHWVNSRTPLLDPRPFEMTVGDHSLFIGNRENDSSIDWLAITTNKNLNLTRFSERPQSLLATRVLPSLQGALPASVEVKVNLHVREGIALDAMIEEIPPQGWAISGISVSIGKTQLDGGKIIWTASQAKSDEVLTYNLAPQVGDKVGFFVGKATDQTNNYTIDVGGNPNFPLTFKFDLLPKPVDIGSDVVFIQAENPHAFTGQMEVRPDSSLASKLYVIALSTGVSSGKTTNQEITFNLNVLKSGTYYIFANCRGENSLSNSFNVGFDVNFVDLALSDNYGYLTSNNGHFERRWFQTLNPGGAFWDVTGIPRPFVLNAGLHTLNWHSLTANAKVDWIAITSDPTLDINAVVEPGQIPPTGVKEYMLY